jgi:two-component system, NtrC family, nitrogen regulation sensor histidine kinase NtrY
LIEQIDGLTTIANAFSNFAKLPQPQMEKLNLLALSKNVIQLFENQENSSIELIVPNDDEIVIEGDKDMLVRVLNNLLANAFQAVPVGKTARIKLSLTKESFLTAGMSGLIKLRVVDNGQGISPDKIKSIFEPYFTTKSTGTGLGLAIVKRILEGHNATICVEESSHNGTTMLVEFNTLD